MKVKWLGHAAFLITSARGTRIITDPYRPGFLAGLWYGKIREPVDIVTISHNHFDHNHVAELPGRPLVIKGPGIKVGDGIAFQGVASYHDSSQGSLRGPNTIFGFTVDRILVCHLGDLGHPLSDAQLVAIGPVDILFIPVGGRFTLDAQGATQVCEALKPRVVIPMHYRNLKCWFLPAGVDRFLQGRANVTRLNTSEVEFQKEQLPPPTQIMVLKPAL